MAARTAVGPCRHCRQPLEHSILRDEDDQPVDWYLGRDDRGGLDSTCPSPDAPTRDCDMCAGTGGELGDPDAEWDCDTCEGTGHTADHQPDLLGRPAPHATEPLGATLPGPRRRRPGDIVTSRAEREDCDWQRDRQDEKCAALGHDLEWTLGPNSWRRGNAYHWLGRCRHDAAEITVGDTWTSCSGIRDARNVRCSGPGTAILTEIEDDRASELVASAVADFGRAAQQALAEPSGALCVVFGPEQPQRVDLLIVTNQRGDDPGAVRGITVHGVDPDEARQEIEPARAAGRAVVINLPGGPFRIPTGLITGYEFITCSCGRPS